MKIHPIILMFAFVLGWGAASVGMPQTAQAQETRFLFTTENGIQACLYENDQATDCHPLSDDASYSQLPWHESFYDDNNNDPQDESRTTADQHTDTPVTTIDSPNNYEAIECDSNDIGDYCIFETPIGLYGCYEDASTDTFVNCSKAADFSPKYNTSSSSTSNAKQTTSDKSELNALNGLLLRLDIGWGGIFNADGKNASNGIEMAFDVGYQWTYFSIAAEIGFSVGVDVLDEIEITGSDYEANGLYYDFKYTEEDRVTMTSFTVFAMFRGHLPFESISIVPQFGLGIGYGYLSSTREVDYTEDRYFYNSYNDYSIEDTLEEESLGSLSAFALKFDFGFLFRFGSAMIGVNASWVPFMSDGEIEDSLVGVTLTGTLAL